MDELIVPKGLRFKIQMPEGEKTWIARKELKFPEYQTWPNGRATFTYIGKECSLCLKEAGEKIIRNNKIRGLKRKPIRTAAEKRSIARERACKKIGKKWEDTTIEDLQSIPCPRSAVVKRRISKLKALAKKQKALSA